MEAATTERADLVSIPTTATTAELEAFTAYDRWQLEAAMAEFQPLLRDINDAELRHWVEVDGKTQTEIAEIVGLSQSEIQRRAARLGLVPKSNRGRPAGITRRGNSDDADFDGGPPTGGAGTEMPGRLPAVEVDAEIVDGEVVEDRGKRRKEAEVLYSLAGSCSALVRANETLDVEAALKEAKAVDIEEWMAALRAGARAARSLERKLGGK